MQAAIRFFIARSETEFQKNRRALERCRSAFVRRYRRENSVVRERYVVAVLIVAHLVPIRHQL